VIAIYNEKREFFLLRDFNKIIGWELVGGYIEKDEGVEKAVNRIILKETGLTIDELQPIAIVNNNFEWENRTVSHVGIAFTALARGKIKPQSKNIEIIYTKTIPDVMAYQDKEILKIAKQMVKTKQYEPPYEEIESSKKFYLLHYLNKYFVKPIFGKLASNKIRKTLLKLISNKPKSIIDVACGDDDFIFQLEKIYNPEICVANDISWKTLSILRKNRKTKVIFTNHNVLDLPFNYKFDLVIFKNTLHHIPLEEQGNLIQKLSTLAKQLIIIDVEDPYRSNFLAKLWHWYYVYLLGDQGGYFLNFEEFKKLISENIKNHDVNFGIINTIKGKYLYAFLLSKEYKRGEEVEIKAKIELSQIKEIKEKLFSLGAILKEKLKENDIYFTAPHRDFIKSKECLRIRERNNLLELTYKGASTKEMIDKKQFWKEEINIQLCCSKEEVLRLLESLGFKRIVEVEKEREKFVIGKHEITIDRVKNCGYFLEIERIVEDEREREKAISENFILLKKLGINEKKIITKPYRDLVLEKLENEI